MLLQESPSPTALLHPSTAGILGWVILHGGTVPHITRFVVAPPGLHAPEPVTPATGTKLGHNLSALIPARREKGGNKRQWWLSELL